MLKIFLYLLLPVAGVAALIIFLDLAEDPGYMLVAWRNVTLETSLVAAVVAAAGSGCYAERRQPLRLSTTVLPRA